MIAIHAFGEIANALTERARAQAVMELYAELAKLDTKFAGAFRSERYTEDQSYVELVERKKRLSVVYTRWSEYFTKGELYAERAELYTMLAEKANEF